MPIVQVLHSRLPPKAKKNKKQNCIRIQGIMFSNRCSLTVCICCLSNLMVEQYLLSNFHISMQHKQGLIHRLSSSLQVSTAWSCLIKSYHVDSNTYSHILIRRQLAARTNYRLIFIFPTIIHYACAVVTTMFLVRFSYWQLLFVILLIASNPASGRAPVVHKKCLQLTQ